MVKVAVIGAGSWGTVAASMVADAGFNTCLWSRRPEHAAEIDAQRRNSAYVPTLQLPASLAVTNDSGAAVSNADFVVVAVPSHGVRSVLEIIESQTPRDAVIVSLTKGLEQETNLRMTQVIEQVLPQRPTAVLTGPNLVNEIARGLPAAAVAASADPEVAVGVQRIFTNQRFRVYTNQDVVGCELGGALKNVVAIGLGLADGLALGSNAKAALLTRGLTELTRVGVALGGDAMTFAGLAGLGDLVATCTSPFSRNRNFGEKLALGMTASTIEASMNQVAEGVKTSNVVLELAREHDVEVPITEAVSDVIAGRRDPEDVTALLMRREPRSELHGLA